MVESDLPLGYLTFSNVFRLILKRDRVNKRKTFEWQVGFNLFVVGCYQWPRLWEPNMPGTLWQGEEQNMLGTLWLAFWAQFVLE